MEQDNKCITEAEWNRFTEIDRNIGDICRENPDGALSKNDADLIVRINRHVIECEKCSKEAKKRFSLEEENTKKRASR